jgi:hypothetical protein
MTATETTRRLLLVAFWGAALWAKLAAPCDSIEAAARMTDDASIARAVLIAMVGCEATLITGLLSGRTGWVDWVGVSLAASTSVVRILHSPEFESEGCRCLPGSPSSSTVLWLLAAAVLLHACPLARSLVHARDSDPPGGGGAARPGDETARPSTSLPNGSAR